MVKHLIIAGHGIQYDGSFDPGATGYIKKGEHKYVRDDLFPAMKRYLPKGADVVFYDKLKVSSNGNLANIVNYYNADQVTEIHFDAHQLGSSARGGHVIIHSAYAPDKYDLALRDAIDSMVGVRYNHRGHKGISGRNNLYNVNDARNRGIAYRLIELGFGTNKTDADIMTKNVDAYAKALVKALFGNVTSKPSAPKKEPVAPSKPAKTASKPSTSKEKSVSAVAKDVIAGKYGSGNARKANLEKAGYNYSTVQAEVNRQLGVKTANKAPKKVDISKVAQDVINGKYGNGSARKRNVERAGYNYSKVQSEVNRILGGGKSKPKGKSIEQMAQEVYKGLHGTGHANRQRSLGVDNATYQKVRARVNQMYK